MREVFLTISIIIGLISPFIAIYSIFKGEYKPQRITRLVFVIILSITTLSLFLQEDRSGIFLSAVQLINCIIIFILSLKYGIGGKSKSDVAVFAMAIITIILWQITDNPSVALYFAILSDLTGISPTLVKSYKQPYTESPQYYLSDGLAGFFSLIAAENLQFNTIIFPLYIFLINFACFLLIIIQRRYAEKE